MNNADWMNRPFRVPGLGGDDVSMAECFVTGIPGLDVTARQQAIMPAGMSVIEFARQILPGVPDECFFSDGRAYHGDWVIPGRLWADLYPPAGTSLVIRLIPGDSTTFRTALQITVLVAAAVASAYLGPIAGPLVAGLAAATITVVGNLLINQFIPIRSKKDSRDPVYTIEGFRNAFSPNSPFVVILGQHRVALPHVARPYTESVGDNQFARSLMGCYGPLQLANFKIGDTPIEKFAGPDAPADGSIVADFTSDFLQIEVRNGYSTDEPVTLYPMQVVETPYNIDLAFTAESGDTGNSVGDEVVRVSPRDVVSASIDLTFPRGLGTPGDVGDPIDSTSIFIDFNKRLLPGGTKTLIESLEVRRGQAEAFTISYPIEFDTRGTYELFVQKSGTDDADGQTFNQCILSAIRGFRPEYPLNFGKPLFLVAVRMRASGQLNGGIDELNCELTSICLDWDSGVWVTRATRNPASLFRYALQGPMKLRPVLDDQINLEQLQDWHDFCTLHNLTYDRVHNQESSVWDVLADICAAGRATPQRVAGKWGVVIDTPRTKYTATITAQNSWGYEEDIPQVKLPDALRMGFFDRTNKWSRAERTVPLPSFVGDPQIFRAIEVAGITDPEVVYREGLRIGYGLERRRRTISVNQDMEALKTIRGDLAAVSHDVLSTTQFTGRVMAISDMRIDLDQEVIFASGTVYGVRFQHVPIALEDDDGSVLTGIWEIEIPVFPAGVTEISQNWFTITPPVGPLPLMPVMEDRFFFGPFIRIVDELLVKGLQRGSNNTAKLLLIDHAPEIEALVEAAEVPDWDGRVGDIFEYALLASTAVMPLRVQADAFLRVS